MKYPILAFAIAGLVAAYGCNSSSTSSTGPTVVIPNAGSSWTFRNVYRDSNQNVKHIDTSVRVIAATKMTYQGFSDVVMLVETFSATKTSDTVYLRYLSSGDVSRLSYPLFAPDLPPVWMTAPYSTHSPHTYSWGGAINALGYTHDTVSITTTYIGPENDTVAGVVYTANVITASSWQHFTSASKDSLIVLVQTNAYIPSIGIFGNRRATLHQINGKQVLRDEQTLIAINLK